ncbi:hypothetical protein L1281_001269 [Neisseria sp. HSC-16F19]|nr:glucose-6-phosphate 1-dehydrogenase family protein [Neisseria sp. HSC-16F19]MCP2040680.1 hypothetical protein [Neisseria sp. HSC-16F19]
MLTAAHCDLFDRPFFQFAQLKQHSPDDIPAVKAAYRAAWQDWRTLVLAVADALGPPFTPPHIERWCNGWQVRAHFFAYFKYRNHADSAAILSLLLNRRRFSVCLDWHAYKAAASSLTLPQYRRWCDGFDAAAWPDFEIWRGRDNEYADHPSAAAAQAAGLMPADERDFFRIGRHLPRDILAQQDCTAWAADTLRRLTPLYEACHAP